MRNLFTRLWKEEEGQDLTEYALLIVMVGLTSVMAIGSLAEAIKTAFSSAAVSLTGTT